MSEKMYDEVRQTSEKFMLGILSSTFGGHHGSHAYAAIDKDQRGVQYTYLPCIPP